MISGTTCFEGASSVLPNTSRAEAQEVPGRSSEKEDRGGGLLHRLGVGTALAVAVASVAAMRIPNMDESSSWAIYRAAADMLASVPEHGRLMIHGDLKTNNVRYLIQCEHLRDDVELWEIQVRAGCLDALRYPPQRCVMCVAWA